MRDLPTPNDDPLYRKLQPLTSKKDPLSSGTGGRKKWKFDCGVKIRFKAGILAKTGQKHGILQEPGLFAFPTALDDNQLVDFSLRFSRSEDREP